MTNLDLTKIPEFFENYVRFQGEENIVESLENSLLLARVLLLNIPESKLEHRYQPGKWTIKEIIGHLIDSERIIGCKIMNITRNTESELFDFDRNTLINNSNLNERSMIELIEELSLVRHSTIALYKSFNDEMLLKKGRSHEQETSVLSLGFIISGHLLHHIEVIKDKYLDFYT